MPLATEVLVKLAKTLVLSIASAALVVTGAGAALAATAPATPLSAGAVVPAASSPSAVPAASSATVAPYLTSVLDPLVAKDTITAAQEQAIVEAWVGRRGALRAEGKQLRSFLSDGVITQAEINQLPADSPVRQAVQSLVQNGQVTTQQLRAAGVELLRNARGAMSAQMGAGGMGPMMRGPLAQPPASPATGG